MPLRALRLLGMTVPRTPLPLCTGAAAHFRGAEGHFATMRRTRKGDRGAEGHLVTMRRTRKADR